MIKFIPFVIFPIFFLLFVLNVENLTLPNKENKNYLDISQDEEKTNFPIPDKIISEENVVPNKANFEVKEEISIVEKKIEVKSNEFKKSEIREKEKQQTEKIKKKELIAQKVIQENKANEKERLVKTDVFFVQFGAFKKKENADAEKKNIEKKLLKRFPEINLKIVSDDKKKMFRLVSSSETKQYAEEICKHTKKLTFNCLLIKK